ncbi:MAG TPA: Na+/H+ antiporter NhaA [Cytophagaceae bacterium]|nr:Na+/H+ antiporter NhaA [Cytophagaceae bacterium]
MAKKDTTLKIFNPFIEFFKEQSISGLLLIAATFVALIVANSGIGESFVHFWETPLFIGAGELIFQFSLEQFINDGLMTIFFIVVGLEIKRELIAGELSTKEKAMLPVVGALGGMLAPALIFTIFNIGRSELSGWAIPTATDIAFSLTVVSLLGKKVPLSLKVFLTALAVVDDLGAIVIIAIFYSQETQWLYLFYSFIVIVVLVFMNRKDVRNIYAYMFVGVFLWIFLHHAGIHATISGVILALTVPFRYKNYEKIFNEKTEQLIANAKALQSPEAQQDHASRDQAIEEMQKLSTTMEAPLNNMLYLLAGFSSFVVMPLFALSNAGVRLDFNALSDLGSTMSLGIIFGLLLGKPIGITLFTFITSKLKITNIPAGVKWSHLFSVNILAGIGFTMSIFVTKLAYTDKTLIETAKFSIIIASFLAGFIGYLVLRLSRDPR